MSRASEGTVERADRHRGARGRGGGAVSVQRRTGSTSILTQALIVGVAAASLIFLSAYGGMVSLAQVVLLGSSGFMLGNMVTKGGFGGETKGSDAGLESDCSRSCSRSCHDRLGLIFGALASRSFGIYFLMLTLVYSVSPTSSSAPSRGSAASPPSQV